MGSIAEGVYEHESSLSYEERLEGLEALESYKKSYYKQVRRVELWKSVRMKIWAAPLVATCVAVSPGVKEHLEAPDYFRGGALAFAATLIGFIEADQQRQNAFNKARKAAIKSIPIVEQLRIPSPPWLEKGLQPDPEQVPYYQRD